MSTQVKVVDVARLAGVSPATVSRALNAPEIVSPDLLEKVQRAAQALNWVPNGAAKALASSRTQTVGLLIPTLNHHNYSALIESMQRELGKANYTLILACLETDDAMRWQQVRKMIEHGVRYVVLFGEAQPPALIELLKAQAVPYVITYTSGRNPANVCIGFDNYTASQAMSNYLLDLGHRSFAMLAHLDTQNDRIQQRIEATKDALSRYGVSIRPELLVRVDGRQIARAREGFRRIFVDAPLRPTALICTNDYIATGAVIEARAMGIDVPGELSIVGFDDIDTSAHLDPPLTTVRVPAREIGEEIAHFIIDSVQGGRAGISVKLDTQLIVRGSSGPPRVKG